MKDTWDKIDVLGKLTSSIVLAIIAMLISQGSDRIAASNERGKVLEQLIADLTASNNKIRQDIALIALDNISGEKDDSLVSRIAERIIYDTPDSNTNNLQSINRVAFDILQRRAPERVAVIMNNLLRSIPLVHHETKSPDIAAGADSLPDNSDVTTTKPLGNATPAQEKEQRKVITGLFKKIVFIQYQDSLDRSLAKGLQDTCNRLGWAAPGVERVKVNFKSSIRFFHPEDRGFAVQVEEITQKYLTDKGKQTKFTLQTIPKTNALNGQVEVWIGK